MALSDDEAEALPLSVSNYYFVDDRDEPISFHVLPLQWSERERESGKNERLFLRGTADNGLQEIYKHVVAWRFDLSNVVDPEILVVSKDNSWIKLEKPRKSFEGTIRSILVSVHCLHYVKRNPETSHKSLWVHLTKVFRLYGVRPSKNDLVDHKPLIRESVKRDNAFARSQFLVKFLEEKPTKRKLSDEDIQASKKLRLMVDDAEDESDDIDNLFSSVCALCDDGGNLLCCEGGCLRSFHATVEHAVGSNCKSLGFTQDEVDATPNFFCKNCEYKKHQCFACGKLGSSDKSSGAEVVPCFSAICGRFYHPRCVAKLLYLDNGISAEELEKKIAMGGSFTCPIHKCFVCKQGENKKDHELQFAVCMRCPKSYHRKCLPREIAFEKKGEGRGGRLITRAWDGLLPNRILIYCIKHEIGTRMRDHIKFPNVKEKKTMVEGKKTIVEEKKTIVELLKAIVEEKKRKMTSESLVEREKVVSKKKKISLEELYRRRTPPSISKQKQKLSSSAKQDGDRNREKVNNAVKKDPSTSMSKEDKISLGDKPFVFMKGSEQVKLGNPNTPDADTKRRLLALVKDAASSITLKDVTQKHKVPSSHAYSSKNVVEKKISLRKVKGLIEAIRTALLKLEQGCSTEDAESVCEPEVLDQILKWKNKLKLYLAPFLHGEVVTMEGHRKSSSKGNGDGEGHESSGDGNNQGIKTSGKLQRGGKEKHRRVMVEISPMSIQEGAKLSASEIHKELLSLTECDDHALQHSEPSKSGMQFGTACVDDTGISEPCLSVSHRRSSGANLDEKLRRDSDICTQICLLEQQDPDLSLSSTYGHQGSAADSSLRMTTSGVQLASTLPPLNELEHSKLSPLGSKPPKLSINSSVQIKLSISRYVPRAGYPRSSMGFAPGPCLDYSLHNSAGWLDE